ncbi:response regulator transcription factor [Pedobacter aquatilis]|uniref:response regulator transcription factor n=1 Tax=Pedobacter aquatilis TaxID=351343 RepID=UPI0025B619AC|nr:response regulator transcription factor [Pedobacter aquatilis]MDN3587547.1 response regulator transcription factor [Pedobacter aquatilis]
MKKIILAEDHTVMRNGLKMLIESTNKYQIVFEACNGQDVLEAFNNGIKADLIISDINMPVLNGIEMTTTLKLNGCQVPVLIMSMLEDNEHFYQAIKAGANGFLNKSVDFDELFFCLSRIVKGERYICSSLAVRIVDAAINSSFSASSNIQNSEFSSREIEILKLIGDGLTNAEMAEKLFISRRTVEGHRQNLIDKTGAKNTAVLMRYAFNRGILN